MDSTLRSSLIRLASANPALRPHLLPILREAAPRLPDGHPRKRLPPARWNTPTEDLPWPTRTEVDDDAFTKAFDKDMRQAFDWWLQDLKKALQGLDRPRDSVMMVRAARPYVEASLRDFHRAIDGALLSSHRESTG